MNKLTLPHKKVLPRKEVITKFSKRYSEKGTPLHIDHNILKINEEKVIDYEFKDFNR